ncbi:MAG: urea ABC transporter ATP-binding protein UrtD [Verrucomicrobiales bacterium]|jgi:urea transport system ATP-binding protein|nr:urea ABC transporter ATP-binding protein UrtD [Verrucomicrobiales bacterium]MDB4527013.1 urea ABC transporter ATP-binding protein UrtD [bacterium]MDC0313174.1 urea ABC transporter ATP-binding protein UrtD [Verrucomicrobiales bacterium]MDF1789437.1 urea ABC transporter ATP-binding protein UrtD [Verrucomicrobiales bacterium]
MSSGSSTDYLLAVEDLTVSFDGFKAVDSLTFYVDADELRVIIGPNGAGKTTVLDLISGKTAASEGSIKFNNQELLGKREHAIVRAGVGRKFQTPSIYEDLTVLENLEISFPWGRTVWGSLTFNRTPEISDKIHKVAEEIYLSDKLDEKAELLSHGQKQWLEIGMLLVQEPELMLLDEPVAGMSVKEREATAKLLKKVAKGRSIIIIEHDMEFVESIANRVTVLHMGKILAEGNMAEIKANETVKHVYLGD